MCVSQIYRDRKISGCLGWGRTEIRGRKWGVTANRHRVFWEDNKNVLKLC